MNFRFVGASLVALEFGRTTIPFTFAVIPFTFAKAKWIYYVELYGKPVGCFV